MSRKKVTLATLLLQERNKAGLTQGQVAKAIGISRYAYIAVEQGRQHFIDTWVKGLPEPMRNAVADYFEQQHREAIEFLRRARVPEVRPARITRPRGAVSGPSVAA
jgi:transcriptional regulator with XRE-family HTH domain